MSNNMIDKKVAAKAVLENGITSDKDFTSGMSQPQSEFQLYSQPQMMFCYKCNNVIPGNSIFCPYCQIELYATCPKCGEEYSSQYPACNQCGTNREEYIETQRREKERIKAEEERISQEKLDREAREREQKETYLKENADIMETKEYKNTYLLLSHAVKDYDKKGDYSALGFFLFLLIITPMGILGFVGLLDESIYSQSNIPKHIFLSIFFITLVIDLFMMFVIGTWSDKDEYLKKYILKKNNYDKDMATRAINIVGNKEQYGLSDCCIIAYREKHNLPINYEWHNNDNVK